MELGINDTALYQPQEKPQMWYQTGMRTSTVIDPRGHTKMNELDMNHLNPATGRFYESCTYQYDVGTWTNSPYPLQPPQLEAGYVDPDGDVRLQEYEEGMRSKV